MDTPTAAEPQSSPAAATEDPCRPAYEWTKDFRIVRTCR
jgi:hypothetical protein